AGAGGAVGEAEAPFLDGEAHAEDLADERAGGVRDHLDVAPLPPGSTPARAGPHRIEPGALERRVQMVALGIEEVILGDAEAGAGGHRVALVLQPRLAGADLEDEARGAASPPRACR